jgi:hypothetical protein
MPSPPCPLCGESGSRPHAEAHGRAYWACPQCSLVHVAPEGRPSPEAERRHYETHENDPEDPRYRAFLDRLALPLAGRLAPGAEGLDYGSGPGPALARMLSERGFPTAVYDPLFAPDESVLGRTYDFVTCTETAEHFFRPGEEFRRLGGLLRPGGWLGVMTEVVDEARPFADWRYARDPTHVCFYRAETLAWIAREHGWDLERPYRNVALFRVPRA